MNLPTLMKLWLQKLLNLFFSGGIWDFAMKLIFQQDEDSTHFMDSTQDQKIITHIGGKLRVRLFGNKGGGQMGSVLS